MNSTSGTTSEQVGVLSYRRFEVCLYRFEAFNSRLQVWAFNIRLQAYYQRITTKRKQICWPKDYSQTITGSSWYIWILAKIELGGSDEKEFQIEVMLLGRLHHKNLVEVVKNAILIVGAYDPKIPQRSKRRDNIENVSPSLPVNERASVLQFLAPPQTSSHITWKLFPSIVTITGQMGKTKNKNPNKRKLEVCSIDMPYIGIIRDGFCARDDLCFKANWSIITQLIHYRDWKDTRHKPPLYDVLRKKELAFRQIQFPADSNIRIAVRKVMLYFLPNSSSLDEIFLMISDPISASQVEWNVYNPVKLIYQNGKINLDG
ncbi:hypothetical protein LXL04_017880 [Taraxacum kok-saghyz]